MEVLVGMSRNADRPMADNFRPVVVGMTRGGGRFVSVPDGVTASVPCGADGVLCRSLVAVQGDSVFKKMTQPHEQLFFLNY